jgi:hypothetical protein
MATEEEATKVVVVAEATEPTVAEEETAAFERLEGLLERLPAMEAKGECLNRAREAQRLLDQRERLEVLEREYAEYHRIRDAALRASQEAAERGDKTAQARELGVVRGYAELIALRAAPLQQARRALEDVWASSPFAPDTELAAETLAEAELAALEREITAYQREYQDTYALCQRFEEGPGAADRSSPSHSG